VIVVERDLNNFKVTLKEPGTGLRSFKIRVETLRQVYACIAHYYGKERCVKPYCPLCKKMKIGKGR
jgi:hypothetical protein